MALAYGLAKIEAEEYFFVYHLDDRFFEVSFSSVEDGIFETFQSISESVSGHDFTSRLFKHCKDQIE